MPLFLEYPVNYNIRHFPWIVAWSVIPPTSTAHLRYKTERKPSPASQHVVLPPLSPPPPQNVARPDAWVYGNVEGAHGVRSDSVAGRTRRSRRARRHRAGGWREVVVVVVVPAASAVFHPSTPGDGQRRSSVRAARPKKGGEFSCLSGGGWILWVRWVEEHVWNDFYGWGYWRINRAVLRPCFWHFTVTLLERALWLPVSFLLTENFGDHNEVRWSVHLKIAVGVVQ